MHSPEEVPPTSASPLLCADGAAWDRLIEAVDPASIQVVIAARMGAALQRRMSADDVWQETLLHAWRSRRDHQWVGLTRFRRWLIGIAENRLRDFADREGAKRRGGGRRIVSIDARATDASAPSVYAGPITTTTPSRVARDDERARLMESVLSTLPDELRQVVFLRLFDDRSLDDIAAELDITKAAVRHRFRKGVVLYHQRLKNGSRRAE